MRPTLFTLFGMPVPSYFAMLATGLILATWLGSRWIAQNGRSRDIILDLGLAMTIMGVIGARVLHVLADGYFWDYVHACTDPHKVSWHISHGECLDPTLGGVWDATSSVCHPKERNCFAWAAFWSGGLTYYGGFIGAAGYAVYFLRRERFPFWKAADMAGFAIPLGLAWGRMGCFLAGCCFGDVCSLPWATRFPAGSPASDMHAREHLIPNHGEPSLPVHPTQLYESIACLALSVFVYRVVAPRRRFDGQMFITFVAGYAIIRFLVEILRRDDRGGFLSISTSQWISLLLLSACLPLWKTLRARSVVTTAS